MLATGGFTYNEEMLAAHAPLLLDRPGSAAGHGSRAGPVHGRFRARADRPRGTGPPHPPVPCPAMSEAAMWPKTMAEPIGTPGPG